jgi:hypothetical protein
MLFDFISKKAFQLVMQFKFYNNQPMCSVVVILLWLNEFFLSCYITVKIYGIYYRLFSVMSDMSLVILGDLLPCLLFDAAGCKFEGQDDTTFYDIL